MSPGTIDARGRGNVDQIVRGEAKVCPIVSQDHTRVMNVA